LTFATPKPLAREANVKSTASIGGKIKHGRTIDYENCCVHE
jgi:hypothetical protein